MLAIHSEGVWNRRDPRPIRTILAGAEARAPCTGYIGGARQTPERLGRGRVLTY